MTLITVPRAVCGGATFAPDNAATLLNPDSDPAAYFSSSRSKAGHLPIVRCVQCGLMMTNPRDDDETLRRIYAALQDEVYDAEEGNRRRTALDHLALVQARANPPGRLLDVGCATGMFVCAAQQAGWQAVGLEASAWAVARARERCPQAMFVAGPLEEAAFAEESFAVVTLWDVLEHVRSPIETLCRAHRWLVPGGWLFLNLPNADSWIATLMGKRWVLLLREHLWYFSPTTMERLLRQCGFELIHTRPNFVRFSLANVAGRLAQYPAARAAQRLAKVQWLRRPVIRFPMGEMNVVARKRE